MFYVTCCISTCFLTPPPPQSRPPKRKALYSDADLGFRTKKVRTLQDHFREYVLEDGSLKKVSQPKLGETHVTTGSIRPVGDIIHLKNDAFPEPIDNIHTFQVKLPCPGVVNFVPENDDDYLLFPRIKKVDVRVYHKTVAMGIPSSADKVGQIRPKNLGVWWSTDTLSEAMKLNPDFPVLDEEDLMIKYNPNGLRMFRNSCQKVSLMDDQDLVALKVNNNTLAEARNNLVKMGGVFNVRPDRTGKGYAGVHTWDVSHNFEPEPLFITTETWNKETGQMHSDSCYMHVWLEEGVLDSNTTIWYTVHWSLEKVTAKEMWYYQNRQDQRKKLIEAGSYLNQQLKAYKEKQQLVYTVKGFDNEMCYLWKTYMTNGNFIPYLAPSIVSRDVSEIETEDVSHKTVDKDKPYDVGDIVLPDETKPELEYILGQAELAKVEAKEGVAVDKDEFKREGVLFEENENGEIKAHDEMDAPAPPLPAGAAPPLPPPPSEDSDYDGSSATEELGDE